MARRRTLATSSSSFPAAPGFTGLHNTPANLLTPLLTPVQATPLPNFFLAGSYTKQDYIDSMEGATLSGRQCAAEILKAAPGLLPKAGGVVAAAARSA